MLASSTGRAKAWSTILSVTSLMLTPNVQSPVYGGVNQTVFSVGMLFPAVAENTKVSTRVLFTNASTETSNTSKNAFETISKFSSMLSSAPFPSLSKESMVFIETSAGSVISSACTITDADG